MSIARLSAATLAVASASSLALAALPAQAVPAVVPFVPAAGQVTASTLNIRSLPTASSTRLATTVRQERLSLVCSTVGQAVAGNRTWYWTSSRANGWVSAAYVHLTQGKVAACSAFPDMHLMNAHVSTAAQVKQQLAGTSASFQAFIAAELKATSTARCRTVISVDAWWKADQAIGSVQGCGGYAALWTFTNGRWHELGTQGVLPCATLRKAGAKHSISGNTGWVCSVPSPAGGHGPTFVQYTR